MGRPKAHIIHDSADAWQQVQKWIDDHEDMTVAKMAEQMGFVSVEAYRSRRWRGEMPAENWAAFQTMRERHKEGSNWRAKGAWLPDWMIAGITALGDGNFSRGVRRLYRMHRTKMEN